jgi:ribosomal protein S18 acetylase RimI-like enzyme
MMQRRRISRSLAFLLSLLCLSLSSRSACCAYSAPAVFGLGALFRGKTVIAPSLGEEGVLTDAGTFFADAFWTDKARAAHRAAGGKDASSVTLTQVQAASLERQQVQEFRRRYGRRGGASTALADRRAELLVCSNASGEVVGCAGVEVDQICKADGRGSGPVMNQIRGPLMSNLAVGRNFRRRGIAEDLVRATEEMARKDWGYDECYLYVEKGNVPAVKLYKKLGYRVMWEDDRAKTLMPLESGKLITAPTVIVCMRKRLSGLGRWLPF